MVLPDPSQWKLNHTMLRIKDPKRSIPFYNLLGLEQINKISMPEAKFDLYFLASDGASSPSSKHHWTDREGVLELTHNYGTETDENFQVANGNEAPAKGFGHIAISVDHIQAACRRIDEAGYPFQKRLQDGKMKSIAFAKDPDGYWVELVPQKPVSDTESIETTDPQTWTFNHTMLRVKDAQVSLRFYQEVMKMTLMHCSEHAESGFNLYFLRYAVPAGNEREVAVPGVNPVAAHQGVLELTWNYGTEREEGSVYHDGNSHPQGFGHICVSVDDLTAACQYFDDQKVKWRKRLSDGKMKTVAFILDPDGYWIELIQNEKLKATTDW